MSNNYDHNQRLQKILLLVELKGKVSMTELCQRFQLTDKVIQQDLEYLEKAYLLKVLQDNACQISNER